MSKKFLMLRPAPGLPDGVFKDLDEIAKHAGMKRTFIDYFMKRSKEYARKRDLLHGLLGHSELNMRCC
jgi:hypothetical protein